MKESQFKEFVKRWLKREGYALKSMVFPLDKVPKKDALRLYGEAHHQLYCKNRRSFTSPSFPEYLFVKRSRGYPDIVGVKNGEAFAFEVKANLKQEQLDRSIGQCLRYLTDSWIDKIHLIVSKGNESVPTLKEIILKFNLPINVIELAVQEEMVKS